MTLKELTGLIDHTILKPDINLSQVLEVCRQTKEHHFASACIPPSFVRDAKGKYPEIKVCTVVGFPLGYHKTEIKLSECKKAISEGADELDLVVNVTDVKSNRWESVRNEFLRINEFIHSNNRVVKWIFQNDLLSNDEILSLCEICNETDVDFAKTSTGFGKFGALEEHVKLMKSSLSSNVKIKASGGIRDITSLKNFVNLGSSRIGTSSGIKIVSEYMNQHGNM